MTAAQKRSDATKYLSRMMRVRRDYCDVSMSGMLIDTLAYQFMETYEHRSKSFLYHDYMARDFFDFLSNKDQTWWRPMSRRTRVLDVLLAIRRRYARASFSTGVPWATSMPPFQGDRRARCSTFLVSPYMYALPRDPRAAARREEHEIDRHRDLQVSATHG
jgi:hypothetical protein